MLNQRIIQTLFIALSILFVDLVLSYLMTHVIGLKQRWATEYVTLIGMLVVIVIFYFGIHYINKISSTFLSKAVSTGRSVFGGSIGAYVAFLVLYVALFVGFHFVWFARLPSFRKLLPFL